MKKISLIKEELKEISNPAKADILKRFFKTRKGEYAYGDCFIGISVPDQRKIVRKYKDIEYSEIISLLRNKIHEYRFCALLFLMRKYEAGEKEKVIDIYFKEISHINNWDLVDISAPRIMGDFFLKRNRKKLERLLVSDNVWKRRIAMVSTLGFIRNNDLCPTFRYAKELIKDEHHLIHKASGWMLREAGKRDKKALISFLQKYANQMPRTMLRYSIERFKKSERKKFLNLDYSRVNVRS